MGGASMGWRYLTRGLWEDRCGGEDGTERKIMRVFGEEDGRVCISMISPSKPARIRWGSSSVMANRMPTYGDSKSYRLALIL